MAGQEMPDSVLRKDPAPVAADRERAAEAIRRAWFETPVSPGQSWWPRFADAILAALAAPAPEPAPDDLRALSDAATPGPWRARLYDGHWQVVDADGDVVAECDGPSDMDNALIAAAVNFVRAALRGRS
jgi:hypothetical protein